jgi:myo-inositol 2-dehydrogenase/D-chiro-inositol 1-dehydrogenase
MEADPSLIRVALLGADSQTAELARAILADDRFELVGACELDNERFGPEAAQLVAHVPSVPVWESLLDLRSVDAVVVARGDDDLRAEQLRKFVQAEVGVLISHPVVDSMLVYYELDMIRGETGSVVVPHLPERHHPGVASLAQMVQQGADSPIGKVEQLVIERSLLSPTKSQVVAQFARDVDLVRAIAGDMSRLGAMAAGGDESAYSGIGVQMSGPRGVVARWSVVPGPGSQGARVTLLGSRGQAAIEMHPGDTAWTIRLTTEGQADSRTLGLWNPAAVSLDQLAGALGGQPAAPDLVDAARAVELAETVDRSLKKGRTIELHFEEYSEQGTFKGTMTSVGCGLLVLAMLALGAVAIAEQMGVPNVRLWPYVLSGVFIVFLLMQLLVFVSRRPPREPAEEAATASSKLPSD